MTTRTILLTALLLGLAACQVEPDQKANAPRDGMGQPAAHSHFHAEIAPIFARNCATCHLTGEEAGRMSLVPGRAIESLVNKRAAGAPNLTRVVPGDPDGSYLVMKLQGTHLQHGGTGAQMPFNASPLSSEEIAKIREWIVNGAKP